MSWTGWAWQIGCTIVANGAMVFLGYGLARRRTLLREIQKMKAGAERAREIGAKTAAQGWLDIDDFCELVSIAPGYARHAWFVRRPWDPVVAPPKPAPVERLN